MKDEKIVINGLKVDFHIHSCFSNFKDGELVKNGKIEDIGVLINNLIKHEINMFSITDHDVFSYEMYKAAKAFEGKKSIKKVFPGIEFSVGFKADNDNLKQVHVIGIFDDTNEGKIKNIENILPSNIAPKYDSDTGMFFTESKFKEILEQIGLDVILIAHQKNSLSSTHPRANDANSIGNDRFNELINVEYFDSFEFKSSKIGIFHNLKKINYNRKYDFLKFITGSDCHEWKIYPKHDDNDNDNMTRSYLKCLPSFRGLKLALTDDTRISTYDNFFNVKGNNVSSIDLTIDGNKINIPLSKGINAIIGDNSIGKSMLIHAWTNYLKCGKQTYSLPLEIKSAYEEYCEKEKISLINNISSNQIFSFDSQGEIRYRFSTHASQLKSSFIASLYPEKTNSAEYIILVKNAFEDFYKNMSNKFEYDKTLGNLKVLTLLKEYKQSKNISVKTIPKDVNLNSIIREESDILKSINEIKSQIKILKNKKIDNEDLLLIQQLENTLTHLLNKHSNKLNEFNCKKKTIQSLNEAIKKFSNNLNAYKSGLEKLKDERDENMLNLASSIKEALILKQTFKMDNHVRINPYKINFNVNIYGKYKFVSRFKNRIEIINSTYLDSIVTKQIIKESSVFDLNNITEDKLKEIVKAENSNEFKGLEGLELLKKKIDKKINEDFENENEILCLDQSVTEGLSSGMNSTIYFDLISKDDIKNGIYIVDQPEDDVSQTKIKDNILKDFKDLAKNRQVILITHNPLFVVNLDVDNVIFLSKNNNGLNINSGALEYKNDSYDILNIVANNLDGGLDSLKKRWKRYEKDETNFL